MTTFQLVTGIVLLAFSVFLVVAVLMQSGKAHNLSGAIAGGAETFFGKTKGKAIDKKLAKLTTAVSIVFVLLVVFMYLIQDDANAAQQYAAYQESVAASEAVADEETTAVDETAAVEGETSAAEGETAAAEETTAA